ncbi:MAG: hypothetical protein JSV53_09400 [candidate division WOR-3 bacterium]|nr:MAG: hypothetical protein JSV53_09400 [candidate division WOR-3 bacterium]
MIIFLLFSFWDYSYDLDVDFNYDNNVYAYSQEYIDDFINGVRQYRFPFETYDDLITSFDFTLLVRNKFIDKRTTTFSIDLNTDNYLLNRQKNYQRYTFGIRQSFGRYAVKLSYQVIPGYLIRYYRDPYDGSTDYIGCEVTYHTARGKISFMTLHDITLIAGYAHRWDNYIPEFNRYDASGHVVSFGLEKMLRKRIDFAFGYEFRNSYTDSADASTSGVDITPDGSFYQHTLSGNLSVQMVAVLPTTMKLSYNYSFRSYETSTGEDSLHFGRIDHRHRIMLGIYPRLITGLRLKLTLMRQWRRATSEVLSDINSIKDYTRYRAGAGFEFYY